MTCKLEVINARYANPDYNKSIKTLAIFRRNSAKSRFKEGAFFHYEILKTDACCGAGLNIASLPLTENIFL